MNKWLFGMCLRENQWILWKKSLLMLLKNRLKAKHTCQWYDGNRSGTTQIEILYNEDCLIFTFHSRLTHNPHQEERLILKIFIFNILFFGLCNQFIRLLHSEYFKRQVGNSVVIGNIVLCPHCTDPSTPDCSLYLTIGNWYCYKFSVT